MPVTPTPEMLALARRCASDALLRHEKWKPGVKAGMHEAIMRGDFDSEAIVAGPLAAIIATTERAATPSAEEIDAAAQYLRETQQGGKKLSPWAVTPKATKKKWLALAEGTLRAAHLKDTDNA